MLCLAVRIETFLEGKDFCLSFNFRSSQCGCSMNKGVLKNFANFTGKYLCQCFLLIKLHASRPVAASKISQKPVWTMDIKNT